MPQKKTEKSTEKRKTQTRTEPKETDTKQPKAARSAERELKRPINKMMPYFLGFCALFTAVCYILIDFTKLEKPMGVIGGAYRNFTCGLFGWGAYLIPILLFVLALTWKNNIKEDVAGSKAICSGIFILLFSSLLQTFYIKGGANRTLNIIEHYNNGKTYSSGGAIGGFCGDLLYRGFGFTGELIVLFALIGIFGMFVFGLTPKQIWIYIRYKIKTHKEKIAERVFDEPVEPDYKKPQRKEEPSAEPDKRKKGFNPDVSLEEEELAGGTEYGENPIDSKIFDEVMEETNKKASDKENLRPVKSEGKGEKIISEISDQELDLSKIFVNPEETDNAAAANAQGGEPDAAETEISVEKRKITETPIKASPAANPAQSTGTEQMQMKEMYVFPPIKLLKTEAKPKSTDVNAELQTNATKLVETLDNFNVKTKIVNISRGPTITRYELMPEAGTRVRAIANLVDDIALSLATTGVRIEAPIPGKAAVGVEVPNKVVATVYVRELIDSEKFKSLPGKLSACLGVDVAGTPIYFDIAKMPHLLIAGATGMGKSVCINSIIMSLLYKASPDEVKFILVDPKKVELNVYNGIPQLLVPVVSDPKKAAGALHWAVTEMERRFELIESVGVRDIKGYNQITADDPEKEFLPQIVIIIDELADLMMTASDEVEDSICRIAQKARAAGMHLIIGTQRPSVDVITGLIKSNIPSRIAFTVASQVDSRTIIDIAGAEKLIGRGDMLYAPVGFSKPVRVQGAFVSDAEVEAVTTFIKEHYGKADYSKDIIALIDKEAAMCGQKRGGALDADGGDMESDPMLRPAIELAIESGKISTSLIQRKLSLGYGRAAKLIDKMEQLGYVSAPEGQKPRDVLITRQQYMEMVVSDNIDA